MNKVAAEKNVNFSPSSSSSSCTNSGPQKRRKSLFKELIELDPHESKNAQEDAVIPNKDNENKQSDCKVPFGCMSEDLSNFLVEKALDHQESKMSVLTRADLDLPSFADLDIDGYVEPTRNQIIFGFLLFLLFPPLACILMYAVIKLDDPRNGIFSTPGFVLSDLLHCVIAGIGVSGYLCRCFNAGWTLRRIVLFTVTFTGTELGGFIALAYAWRFPTPLAFPVVVGLAVQSSFFVLCLDIYGAKKLRDWNFAKRFAPLLGLSGKGNFRLPFPYHPKQRNEDHCFLRTPSEYAGIVE